MLKYNHFLLKPKKNPSITNSSWPKLLKYTIYFINHYLKYQILKLLYKTILLLDSERK